MRLLRFLRLPALLRLLRPLISFVSFSYSLTSSAALLDGGLWGGYEKRAMAVREEQWLQTIAAAKQSGQPIKVWCAEHGVPVSSFYKWQRKMRDSLLTAQNSEIQFQELEVPQNICGPATSDRIHLHIQDILVELPAGASAEQISAVVRGIRHAG